MVWGLHRQSGQFTYMLSLYLLQFLLSVYVWPFAGEFVRPVKCNLYLSDRAGQLPAALKICLGEGNNMAFSYWEIVQM